MSYILLIRHGDCDPVGKYLAGRSSGINLNSTGVTQVNRLSEMLGKIKINRLISSPLERTMQTAERIAHVQGISVEKDESFLEIDYGNWTGKTFQQLANDQLWNQFNVARSTTRVPGGEMMIEVQERIVKRIRAIGDLEPNSVIGIVSHSDPIKTAICAFCGIPLDMMHRLVIDPASVSAVRLGAWGAEIHFVNKFVEA